MIERTKAQQNEWQKYELASLIKRFAQRERERERERERKRKKKREREKKKKKKWPQHCKCSRKLYFESWAR